VAELVVGDLAGVVAAAAELGQRDDAVGRRAAGAPVVMALAQVVHDAQLMRLIHEGHDALVDIQVALGPPS
jgi:hypothetical protein